MWCYLILLLAVFSYFDSASSAVLSSRRKRDDGENGECQPWFNPVLPDTIEPIRYDLYLSPRFYSSGTLFYGNVTININVLNRTKDIIVHAKELKIGIPRLYDRWGGYVPIYRNYTYWIQNDYFVMQAREFMLGRMSLHFPFSGNMSLVTDSLFKRSGLYNIPYANGRSLLVSDFRPSKARYIFPNFDEPRFKANFKIRLNHRNDYTPISNMPAEGLSYYDQGSKTTDFYLTPKISSNQVIFAITDFRYKKKTVDGMQLRLFAQADRLPKMDYVLELSSTILSHLHQELDMVSYFRKLDFLAIPGDNLAALADSWKFATFQESTLLFNATTDVDHARSKAQIPMTRTLTRSYFLTILTSRCWEHGWLIEALATFYEIRIVTEIDPTGMYKEYFFGWKVDNAMFEDALQLPGSLVLPSDSLTEMTPGAFAYKHSDKGAAVLRMVENFVGADKFKRGIRQFLRQNVNGTVVTDDLWTALQQEYGNGLDIKKIMTNWVAKRGLPVITIERLPGNRINATQKQFLNCPFPANETNNWYVPLTYRTKGGIAGRIWMNETDVIFEIPELSSDDWIEFNSDGIGYYRVNYGEDLWNMLAKQLNEDRTVFSELSRAKLFNDASVLAQTDVIGYDVFLNLTRYASEETDLTPWFNIHKGLQEIVRLINTTTYCCFQRYMLNLTSPLMDRLQVEAEGSSIEQELRPKVVSLSCAAGHEGCRVNLTRAVRSWIENNTTDAIRQNLIRYVSCTGIADALQEPLWNAAFEKYKRATSAADRSDLLRALSCIGNVTILEKLLDYSLNTTFKRDSPSHMVIHYIAKNPLSENSAWNWLKRKYTDVERTIGSVLAEHYFFISAAQSLNTEAQYQEVVDFCDSHRAMLNSTKDAVKGYVRANICWLERNSNVIAQWLDQNAGN